MRANSLAFISTKKGIATDSPMLYNRIVNYWLCLLGGGNAYDGSVNCRGRPRNRAVCVGNAEVCEVKRSTTGSKDGFEKSCKMIKRKEEQNGLL